MVLVTKDEKEKILQQYPDICIVRTVKQKSKRHRYYCEEQRGAMRLLRKLRGIEETSDNKRRNNNGRYKGARR